MNKVIHNILILTCTIILMTACGTSKQVPKSEESAASVVPTEKALLWKIEKKGIKKPSYLFGTIHIIDEDDFFIPKGTEDALDDVEKIVFEIDIAEMSDLGAQMSMFSKAMMNNGVKLSDLLSEEDYKIVKDHFDGLGLPIMMLERIKPLFLSALAGDDIDITSFGQGGGSTISYEFYFYDEAKNRQLETGGLETIDFQLSIFDSIPYEAQAQMLVDAIQPGEGDDDMMEETYRLYIDQDIQGMVSMMVDDGGIGGYEEILLEKRNMNWIPSIGSMMEEGPTFFAVGAGHLGGELGVIALLREKGFTLTPLSHK